ncbi:hypothetical protein L596_019356 [Steinernema carpocapsae]|uniref:Uncharacterized protein n=1 Tax=Steinernema carpocapsae TaxID=34508 RepID=A0A4U5MQA3_STECR|nr:hypothetical protein L596_019356 [Steinernema carpocapsae]
MSSLVPFIRLIINSLDISFSAVIISSGSVFLLTLCCSTKNLQSQSAKSISSFSSYVFYLRIIFKFLPYLADFITHHVVSMASS